MNSVAIHQSPVGESRSSPDPCTGWEGGRKFLFARRFSLQLSRSDFEQICGICASIFLRKKGRGIGN
jgi:hypothetical protein